MTARASTPSADGVVSDRAAGALTIQEAALTTGWSARMLRYIEEAGLVLPGRSHSGYRLYGPAELQRLRTLRHLLEEFGIELSDVGFALRLERDAELRDAVRAWLVAPAIRPIDVSDSNWLAYEQEKHLSLLATANDLLTSHQLHLTNGDIPR